MEKTARRLRPAIPSSRHPAYLRLPHPLLHVHAARGVANRLRLETIGRAVEELGHAALLDVLAVDAAVALMMRRRHVVVAADHALEVAVDDGVAVVAEDVVRHERDLPAAAGRVHHELRDGEAG